jgi:hypothetical protein
MFIRKSNMRNNEGGGGEFLTLLLVGVGVYFVFEWFMGQGTSSTTTTPGTTSGTTTTPTSVAVPSQMSVTSTTGTTTPVTTPPTPTPTPMTTSQINQLTQTLQAYQVSAGYPNATYSGYQWEYIAQRAFASSFPSSWVSSGVPGVDGDTMYSQTQFLLMYMQALSTQGLTGLGCGCNGMYGLGVLQSQYMYSKLNNKRGGWPVGSFAAPIAGKYEAL